MPKALIRSERIKIRTFNRIVKASYKVLVRKDLVRATLNEILEVAGVANRIPVMNSYWALPLAVIS